MECFVAEKDDRRIDPVGPLGERFLLGETGALRVGIINIMPQAESYEPFLTRPLEGLPFEVSPVWIRLASHQYSSSDGQRIRRRYRTYEEVSLQGLDALILTGAPVEELDYDQITYWSELSEILRDARARVPSTLGICWGGMALSYLLGLEKENYGKKLFGVFQNRRLHRDHPLTEGAEDLFWCAQSRHSGISSRSLEAAARAGEVSLLSHGEETGYTWFESADRRFLIHLGHPEYEASRLVAEWERDRALGRTDVSPPQNFDPERPVNLWRAHCSGLFSNWLGGIASEKGASRLQGQVGFSSREGVPASIQSSKVARASSDS